MGGINNRTIVVASIMLAIGLLYIGKLFVLQVYDPSYKFSAESNTRRKVTQYPSRGLIYDRNGKLLVSNQAVYDVMVVPRELAAFDSIDFCESLDITIEDLREMFVEMRSNMRTRKISSYKPSVFYKQLSAEKFGRFQEKLYKFKGFFVQGRSVRKYEYPLAAHVLGYLGEVNQNQLDQDTYYEKGDYVGISGIELTYEKELRGTKGVNYVMVDVHGRSKGSFREGRYDTAAITGRNLTLSLDIELQEYAEKLMQNKIGSIVAIEPSSGEILTFVSAPGYDPSLLVGRSRGEGFSALASDSLKPLNNRALQGTYSPGSSFKLVNAAIAFQEGAINDYTRFECAGPSATPIRCTHHHRSPIETVGAIETSCNPFFYQAFKQTLERPGVKTHDGYVAWYNHVRSFGFGEKLGIDLPYEITGSVPSADFYDKLYNGRWIALTVRSLGIGQGELLVTPLQMANEAAVFANRGFYYSPHVVKAIENQSLAQNYTDRINTSIESQNLTSVIEGMSKVFSGEIGTARYYYNDTIPMCGKTGTVQNPFGEDHSVFIAFAPKDNPKIAISVIVENAGFGSTWAAPMATLLMEKYIAGEIPLRHKFYEKKMLEGDFIHAK
nr:penicillin-binding protein 2 [uncultured Carboxylicivirga sp.]